MAPSTNLTHPTPSADLGELPPGHVEELARRAVAEDLGRGDITCRVVGLGGQTATGRIVFEEEGVVCGLPLAAAVLSVVDPAARLLPTKRDGELVVAGEAVVELSGRAASLLAAERVMLNFLQRLSGVATQTMRYRQRMAHTSVRLLDTRKTTPGLRLLEKYAVRAGGGVNHRMGLDDGIMIKDNHIIAAGGVAAAVRAARDAAPPLAKVCVEVENEAELDEALASGAHHVLLDNFELPALAAAVGRCRERAPGVTTEASGGIGYDGVAAVAETGVDYVSVGALTHSARALSIKMELLPREG